MNLTRSDVAKVALLARLRLGESDLDLFTGQLNAIVAFVDALKEPDTSQVEPLAHGVDLKNVFREDKVGEPLPREDALANAPKRNAEAFLVPAVLE